MHERVRETLNPKPQVDKWKAKAEALDEAWLGFLWDVFVSEAVS